MVSPALPAPEARAIEPRIDAVPGRPLVAPVVLDPPGVPARDTLPVEVALSAAGPLTSELIWFAPRLTTTHGEPIEQWLDRAVEWSATASWALEPGAVDEQNGFWALVINLPEACAGQKLLISGREAPVQWLAAPAPAPDPAVDQPFRPERPGLRAMLAPARRDPLNRWRTRLLLERLHAPRGTVFDRYEERMATHALEALADQAEWRWRVALDRLANIDPFLAADLLNRLTAVIDFGDGRLAPAWPTDEAALGALRTELLAPDARPQDLRRRAAAFVDTVSTTTAWVIDDAGSVDAQSGATMAILGVAERAGRAITARVAIEDASPAVDVAPLSVRRLAAAMPRSASDAPLRSVPAHLEVGRRSERVEVLPLGAPVRPPGLRIGPGFLPWTLDAWTQGRALPAPPDLAFDLLLHKRGDESGAPWQMYIECPMTPIDAVNASPDAEQGAGEAALRILLGPTARAVSVLRLGEDGSLVDEVSAESIAPVYFERRADRFVAIVPLPSAAIGADGLVRIAVERVDPQGHRATWPRPVLPWDPTPGRAGLDLASWRALTPDSPAPVR